MTTMLLAQLDQASELMKVSANRGWEASMLAFFFIFVVALLGWLIHSMRNDSHDREERMAKRLDGLEDFQRSTLLEALQDNSKALHELTATLSTKPCLKTREHGSLELETLRRKHSAKS